jgi:hypothetical protein
MRCSAIVPVVLATLSAVHGCAPVEGGAVEVSWDLRGIDGQDRDCAEADVVEIQLAWEHDTEASKEYFPCEDARGVTGFTIPVGEVRMRLIPVCDDADAIAGFRSPPEIVRTITEGEVITLTTQIIDVKVTDCTAEEPCVCP